MSSSNPVKKSKNVQEEISLEIWISAFSLIFNYIMEKAQKRRPWTVNHIVSQYTTIWQGKIFQIAAIYPHLRHNVTRWIMGSNPSGAFVHNLMNWMFLYHSFLSKIAYFFVNMTYILLIHHAIFHNHNRNFLLMWEIYKLHCKKGRLICTDNYYTGRKLIQIKTHTLLPYKKQHTA